MTLFQGSSLNIVFHINFKRLVCAGDDENALLLNFA